MKTLHFLIATILLTSCVLFAGASPAKYHAVSNSEDLRFLIKNTIRLDFKRTNNFMYENNIDKVDDCVQVYFTVDSNNEIRILKSKAKYDDSVLYIKQLFDKLSVDIDESMIGKHYEINIVLKYQAS